METSDKVALAPTPIISDYFESSRHRDWIFITLRVPPPPVAAEAVSAHRIEKTDGLTCGCRVRIEDGKLI